MISTLWASKFHTRWYYHYWWAWLSILQLLKVTSFQYPFNTSKKKYREGWSSFFTSIWTSKFLQVGIIVLMEVTRNVQSAQNTNLVIFFQYPKRNMLQLLFCSVVMQNIQIFYGCLVIFIVTCYCHIATLLLILWKKYDFQAEYFTVFFLVITLKYFSLKADENSQFQH